LRLIMLHITIAIKNRELKVIMTAAQEAESDSPKFLLTPAMYSSALIPNRMDKAVGISMGKMDTYPQSEVQSNFHAIPDTICLYGSFRKKEKSESTEFIFSCSRCLKNQRIIPQESGFARNTTSAKVQIEDSKEMTDIPIKTGIINAITSENVGFDPSVSVNVEIRVEKKEENAPKIPETMEDAVDTITI